MKKSAQQLRLITEDKRIAAEEEIRIQEKIVDYDTKEYPVEVIVQKYLTGKDEEENELFVPEYQRDFVWPEKHQSKFIESVMLGLPIPYIFTAAPYKEIGEDEGRVEIVDGSQRIRTLAAFLNDDFELTGLEKLKSLNGFRFGDLELSRQRRFKRRPIRIIELSDQADDLVRRDIFERINTGSVVLKPMEQRKGIFDGPFYDFIDSCAAEPLFNKLCPISAVRLKREEAQEMVLRYFAYADNYQHFQKSVVEFMNEFIIDHRSHFDIERMRSEFIAMLEFTQKYFPNGFKKSARHHSVPRVRFEALSVGITLALREKSDLAPDEITSWLESEEFKKHTVSDASNSRPRVVGRIEFVKNKLLGR